MTLLPVIARELRAEARRSWNFWARVTAGALVLVGFILQAWSTGGVGMTGTDLFQQTSLIMMALIWLVTPLLTSDCLSREKREGTLGLLFLTPLTPTGIVVGKSLVHAIRAASVSLAALPVLSLSILLGGVSGQAIVLLLFHQIGALALTLAAGLLASAWTRDWMRSVLLTGVLVSVFAWVYYAATSIVGPTQSLRAAGLLMTLATLLMFCALFLAARRIRSTWQESPPSPWVLWCQRTFCSPILWTRYFHSLMRRSLNHNPVGWLHERTATARISKWVWCLGAVFLSGVQISFGRAWTPYVAFQVAILLAMAFAGAASFRRERQNGMLELLLVAPLRADEIVQGRLQSVRKQFLPAIGFTLVPMLLLIALVGDTGSFMTSISLVFPQSFLFLTSLWVLPKLGILFALRGERFLTAWALTFLVGLAAPALLARSMMALGSASSSFLGMMAFFQFGLGQLTTKKLDELERSQIALQ